MNIDITKDFVCDCNGLLDMNDVELNRILEDIRTYRRRLRYEYRENETAEETTVNDTIFHNRMDSTRKPLFYIQRLLSGMSPIRWGKMKMMIKTNHCDDFKGYIVTVTEKNNGKTNNRTISEQCFVPTRRNGKTYYKGNGCLYHDLQTVKADVQLIAEKILAEMLSRTPYKQHLEDLKW